MHVLQGASRGAGSQQGRLRHGHPLLAHHPPPRCNLQRTDHPDVHRSAGTTTTPNGCSTTTPTGCSTRFGRRRRLATELRCLAHTAPVSAAPTPPVGNSSWAMALWWPHQCVRPPPTGGPNRAGRRIHAGIEVQNGEGPAKFRYGIKFAMLATRPDTIRNNASSSTSHPCPPAKATAAKPVAPTDMIDRVVADPDVRCDGGVLRRRVPRHPSTTP